MNTPTTATTIDSECYIRSILGQQNPLEIIQSKTNDGFMELLRADSLWNLGRGEEAQQILKTLTKQESKNHSYFYDGLKALLDGKLPEAYDSFLMASHNSTGLNAVFFGERAVNIAFWMACSEKMLNAGKDLPPVDTIPYAGGVQAFCQHMNGQHTKAETTARKAIAAGYQDPWTLHAIAHSLYSQGRQEECIQFLDDHRTHIQACNLSAFMKGHLEFHQALCFIALKDSSRLENFINGPLWKDLSDSERNDYWNATGLLNVHWKAELNGLSNIDKTTVDEALAILQPTASPSKSYVFALCILRWSKGDFRNEWKEQLLKCDSSVLKAMTEAVDLLYPDGTPNLNSAKCKSAQEILLSAEAASCNHLVRLGASPEQREVLDDFLRVIDDVAASK